MTIGPLAALCYRFTVEVEEEPLAHHVSHLLGGLAGAPAEACDEAEQLALEGPGCPRLTLNGETVAGSTTSDRLLPSLMGHLNRRAVTSSADRLLLLHAGGVVAAGMAVILPGAAESGKTTLTAGLVRAGLGYLTDEAVGIRPDSLDVLPYAKPLSVDPGSWAVLRDLAPVVDDVLLPLHAAQWQVSPADIRPGAVAPVCPPAVVVFPRYVPGSATTLSDMERADAVVEMAQNSLNFRDRGLDLLPVVAAVAARCRCYRLTVGDLSEACERVLAVARRHVRVPA